MNKHILTYILTVFVIIGCNPTKSIKADYADKYCGRYLLTPVNGLRSDSIIIELTRDHLFKFEPHFNNSLDRIYLCKCSLAHWKERKEHIIVDSEYDPQSSKYAIRLVGKITNTDSVKIRIVNYSDNSPFVNYDVVLFNRKNSIVFDENTNNNGEILIPRKGYNLFIFFQDHIGHYKNLKKLRGGYSYQLTFFDCFPEVFINKTFKIIGDTLFEKKAKGLPPNCYIRQGEELE